MKKAVKIVFLVLFVFLIFAPAAVPGFDCRDKAKQTYQSVITEAPSVIGAKNVLLVFNDNGRICYRSHNRITQGDVIWIGVYGKLNEINSIRISVPTCNLEPTTPLIEDTTKELKMRINENRNVNETVVMHKWTGGCFDDEIKIEAKYPDVPSNNWQVIQKQYKRFVGTFQIGVLCTDLEDPNFSTVLLARRHLSPTLTFKPISMPIAKAPKHFTKLCR